MAAHTRFLRLIFLLALASHLRGQPASLIHFELQDQFDRNYSEVSFRGKSLLIILCDRVGARFGPAWGRALDARLGPNWRARTNVVTVAELPRVPRLLRGWVKGRFPRQTDLAVLLDWDAAFARAYGFHADNCNLLVFDTAGRLLQRAHGQEPDATRAQQLADAILSSQAAGR